MKYQFLKPRAVLALNPAGFGDMLRQINKFFWICDFYGYRPKVFFKGANERNEVTVEEFFERLNISCDNLLSDHFNSKKSLKFTSFLERTESRPCPFSTYYFEFDAHSYNVDFNSELEAAIKKQHPRIVEAIRGSELYARIINARKNRKKRKICIHVRRGDAAQINAAAIRSIIKEKVNPDLLLHPVGIFLPSWIDKKVQSPFLSRHRPMADYQAKLDQIIRDDPQETEVVLVSDGMTKLAQNLKTNYNYIFKDPGISLSEVETSLEAEFSPLLDQVTGYWIGEEGTFWESLIQAASSDIIISNSPAFFRDTTKGLGLNIKYIKP